MQAFLLVLIWICLDLFGRQAEPASTRLCLNNLGAEPDDRVKRRLRLVELRRVAAGFENEGLDGRGGAGLDGADLLHGSILVVRALNDERGNAPAPDRILDVPGPEAGVEPGAVPATEGDVDMAVIFGELRPQLPALLTAPRLRDRRHPHPFAD